jgi:hypothetical protein
MVRCDPKAHQAERCAQLLQHIDTHARPGAQQRLRSVEARWTAADHAHAAAHRGAVFGGGRGQQPHHRPTTQGGAAPAVTP